MMRNAPALVVLVLLFACGNGRTEEEQARAIEERCLRMRDHLIDLRLETTMPPGSASNDATRSETTFRQHREAMIAALGEDFSVRCASSLSSAQIDCVMDADDNGTVSACSNQH
jgi:hypothetical protein